MTATAMTIAAIDQATATLVAAVVAALASLLSLVPKFLELRQQRQRRRRLIAELSRETPMRSYKLLSVRLGMSEDEVASMIADIDAHGVLMRDNDGNEIRGVALDSRHDVRS